MHIHHSHPSVIFISHIHQSHPSVTSISRIHETTWFTQVYCSCRSESRNPMVACDALIVWVSTASAPPINGSNANQSSPALPPPPVVFLLPPPLAACSRGTAHYRSASWDYRVGNCCQVYYMCRSGTAPDVSTHARGPAWTGIISTV
jgi:hypothetical protein